MTDTKPRVRRRACGEAQCAAANEFNRALAIAEQINQAALEHYRRARAGPLPRALGSCPGVGGGSHR